MPCYISSNVLKNPGQPNALPASSAQRKHFICSSQKYLTSQARSTQLHALLDAVHFERPLPACRLLLVWVILVRLLLLVLRGKLKRRTRQLKELLNLAAIHAGPPLKNGQVVWRCNGRTKLFAMKEDSPPHPRRGSRLGPW